MHSNKQLIPLRKEPNGEVSDHLVQWLSANGFNKTARAIKHDLPEDWSLKRTHVGDQVNLTAVYDPSMELRLLITEISMHPELSYTVIVKE